MTALRALLVALSLVVVAGVVWWLVRDPRPHPAAASVISAESLQVSSTAEPVALDARAPAEATAELREAADPPVSTPSPTPTPAEAEPALRGRVVDDLGAPVRVFGVELIPIPRPIDLGMSTFPVEREFDSADGRFAIDSLDFLEWRVYARAKGDRRSNMHEVELPGDGVELEFVLPRAACLTGRVLTTSGAQVVDGQIFVEYPGETPTQSRRHTLRYSPPRATTDATGSFALADLRAGSLLVIATHPDGSETEALEVSLAPAETKDIVLRVAIGGRITGVIDATEGELANRQIDLFSFRETIGWRTTRSSADGSFAIEHVIPQDYVIELRPPGYPGSHSKDAPSIRKRVTVEDGENTHVIFGGLRTTIAVRGLVVSRGEPVPGVDVRATREANDDRGERSETDARGRFELEVDGAGVYRFGISSRPNHFAIEREVGPAGEGNVVLELPGGAIGGTVLDRDGKPLAQVPVTIAVESARTDPALFWRLYRRTKTDGDGTFEFRWLEPGSYSVRAPDGLMQEAPPQRVPFGGVVLTDVRVANERIERELQLLPEGRIAGTVTGTDKAPVGSASIQVYDESGVPRFAAWEARSDSTGRFEILSLAPGTCTVAAQKEGRRGTSAPVRIDAGSTSEVRIELP